VCPSGLFLGRELRAAAAADRSVHVLILALVVVVVVIWQRTGALIAAIGSPCASYG